MLRQSLYATALTLAAGVVIVTGWVYGQPPAAPVPLVTVSIPPAPANPPLSAAAPPAVPGRTIIATSSDMTPVENPPVVPVPPAPAAGPPAPLAARVLAESLPEVPRAPQSGDRKTPDDGLPLASDVGGKRSGIMQAAAPANLPDVAQPAVYRPEGTQAGTSVRPAVFQPPDAVPPPPFRPGDTPSGSSPPGREPAAGAPAPATTGTATAHGAAVALETTMPAETALGKPLVCEIIVRNTGAATATGVHVEAPVPAGTRMILAQPQAEEKNDHLAWSLGDLEMGAERRIRVELQAREDGEVVLSPTAAFGAGTAARARVVRPPFAVQVTGPESVVVGSEVLFKIQVSNRQANPITSIIVRDQLPPGLKHPQGSTIAADLGTLEPNQTRTIELRATAVQTGRLVNPVTAKGDGGVQAGAQAVVVVTEPKVSLRVGGPKQTPANRELDFQLDVTNPGSAPVTGVRLTQTVPEGLEFVSASTGGACNAAGRAIEWTLGTLAAGQTQGVTFKLRARQAGDWAMPAKLAAEGITETTADHKLHVEGAPELTLEVRALENPVGVGAETTYEMHVVNQGSAPSSGVKLVVAVPDALEPVRPDGPTTGVVTHQQVVFEPLAQLAPHTEALYKLRVRGRQAGEGRFRVELTGAALKQPVVEEVGSRVGTAPAWNAPQADNSRR